MEKQEKPLIQKMRENYAYFGGLSAVYGLIFAFCLYKNTHGITFIIYTAATIAFALLFMKKIEFKLQKGSIPYIIGMILLSIAMFFTTDYFFIAFNWIGTLLLFAVMMIHQFYNDNEWNFPAYLKRLFILLGTSIGYMFYPLSHGIKFLSGKESGKKRVILPVLTGLLVALCLLAVIMPLLLKSDLIFAEFFGKILRFINIPTIMGVSITIVIGFVACYAFFSALCTYNFPAEKERRTKYYNPIVGITFNSVLAFIYMLYSGIQVVYLFLGLQGGLPHNVTYSEYARRGFWELLFVSIINFILVLVCMYIFSENKLLKVILTIISLCTFVMLISAAYRIQLYVAIYHLTFLRVLVMWFLLVLALIIGGIIVSIYVKSFPLFRYIMAVVSVCYISFALVRPNYWIAQYNVSHTENMTMQDLKYLMYDLDEDAALAISKIHPEDVSVSDIYEGTVDDVKGGMYHYFENVSRNNQDIYFRKANYVRIRAKSIADAYLKEHAKDKKYARDLYFEGDF